MSVNIAEGSVGIFTSFEIYPNSYVQQDSTNLIELIEFPSISYNDIVEVIIEKAALNGSDITFSELNRFPLTDNKIHGKVTDEDFIQGNTYVYRLSLITNNNQQIYLTQKSTSTQLADPTINCAKLNNVYRKACHNCFQESIVDPDDGGFYQALFHTRVVELDVWPGNPAGTWNWEVRHKKAPWCQTNCNNCGYDNSSGEADGDKPFGICIDDIKLWHNTYPNHDPIILFIDLKDDWDYGNNHTPADLDQKLLTLTRSAFSRY